LQRERQIVDALDAGDRTLADLRSRIYPDLDPRLAGAAEIQLSAHLIKLVEEGHAEARIVVSSQMQPTI
jgi:hypothetical protein